MAEELRHQYSDEYFSCARGPERVLRDPGVIFLHGEEDITLISLFQSVAKACNVSLSEPSSAVRDLRQISEIEEISPVEADNMNILNEDICTRLGRLSRHFGRNIEVINISIDDQETRSTTFRIDDGDNIIRLFYSSHMRTFDLIVNDNVGIENEGPSFQELTSIRSDAEYLLNACEREELSHFTAVEDLKANMETTRRMVDDVPNPVFLFAGAGRSGKSTLINALLGEQACPSGFGLPVTASAFRICFQENDYSATVSFVQSSEFRDRMEGTAQANDDGHLEDIDRQWGFWKPLLENVVIGDGRRRKQREFCRYLRSRSGIADGEEVMPAVHERVEEILTYLNEMEQHPLRLGGYENVSALSTDLRPYVTNNQDPAHHFPLWPLVREATVLGPFNLLRSGLVIMDVPGYGDINLVRGGIVDNYLAEATHIFVVVKASMGAPEADSQFWRKLNERQLFRKVTVCITHVRVNDDVAPAIAPDFGFSGIDLEKIRNRDPLTLWKLFYRVGFTQKRRIQDFIRDVVGEVVEQFDDQAMLDLSLMPMYPVNAPSFGEDNQVQWRELTGIPALDRHLKQLIQYEQQRVYSLRTRVEHHVQSLRNAVTEMPLITDEEREVAQQLRRAFVDELRASDQRLAGQFDGIITELSVFTPVFKWQSTVLMERYRHSLAWNTFKAAMGRNGVFGFDVNSDVAGIAMTAFGPTIRRCLNMINEFTPNGNIATNLRHILNSLPPSPYINTHVFLRQCVSILRNFNESRIRDISIALGTWRGRICGALGAYYCEAYNQSGTGMFDRMIRIMETGCERSLPSIVSAISRMITRLKREMKVAMRDLEMETRRVSNLNRGSVGGDVMRNAQNFVEEVINGMSLLSHNEGMANLELDGGRIPILYRCAISFSLLSDPVTLNAEVEVPNYFNRYDLSFWCRIHETDPLTRMRVTEGHVGTLGTSTEMLARIDEWLFTSREGREFRFSVEYQDYLQARGLANNPVRQEEEHDE